MDKQELELLEGFRRLGHTARNTIMTAVAMAVTAEDAVRREMGGLGIPPAEAEVEVGNELAVTTA